MDCPDCGTPMYEAEITRSGDDTFMVIEIRWACYICDDDKETETGKDER